MSERVVDERNLRQPNPRQSKARRVGWSRRVGSGLVLASALLLWSGLAPRPAGACTPEQRLAEAEIQAVGTALFAWLTDQITESETFADGAGSSGVCELVTYDVTTEPVIAHGALEALLVPAYLPALPTLDPWGQPYEYRLDPNSLFDPVFGAIRSAGADGVFSGTSYPRGEVGDPDGDLVWSSGVRVRATPLPPYRRQPETVADLGAVGIALTSWLTDQIAGFEALSVGKGGAVDLAAYAPITAEDLAALLVPSYIACVPAFDRWGNPYDYRLNLGDLTGSAVMALRSPGEDGLTSGDSYVPGGFPASERQRDLVWADGVLVRFPQADGRFFDDGFEGGDTCAWSGVLGQ